MTVTPDTKISKQKGGGKANRAIINLETHSIIETHKRCQRHKPSDPPAPFHRETLAQYRDVFLERYHSAIFDTRDIHVPDPLVSNFVTPKETVYCCISPGVDNGTWRKANFPDVTWRTPRSNVCTGTKQLPNVHIPTPDAMVLRGLRCIGRRRRDL